MTTLVFACNSLHTAISCFKDEFISVVKGGAENRELKMFVRGSF
jgi:hypothetical protein